jgi:amino acid adenylation domain-containing protein
MTADLSVPRRPGHPADAPLSYAQEGIWLTELVYPQYARFTGARAFAVRGHLDMVALRAAVAGLVARHESLRTTVDTVDGLPRQIVHTDVATPLDEIDLRAEADADAAAAEFVDAAGESRFDLANGPLFRAFALHSGPGAWTLLLVVHHLVIDLLSWPILLQDLRELYRAAVDGDHPALGDLPIRPSDYAAWQRARESEPQVRAQVERWSGQLAEVLPLLDLPTDRRRQPGGGREGAVLQVPLAGPVASATAAFVRAERTTLMVATLAALGVLMSRYTGQDRLTIGLPVAGDRFMLPGMENMVGMLAGSFPVPIDLRGGPAFRDVVTRVKRTVFAAMANRDAPYELLMKELRPQRSLGSVPFQQVSINIRYPERRSFTLPGVQVSAVPITRWSPLSDLTLTVDASTDEVKLVWIYDGGLFDETTIAAMADRYAALLSAAVENPDLPVGELPLGADDAGQAAVGRSPAGTVHGRFAAQARRDPAAPAVVHGGCVASYGDLDRRANAVASALRRRGVRREDAVGVCLPRSLDLVTAYLGILKAGAAYVPLDPGYPGHRIAEMLAVSGARLVVADPHFAGLGWETGPEVVPIADLQAEGGPGDVPADDAHPDCLAYVMFTSGSTGRPKGVAISHRGVLGLVVDANYVRVAPGDRVAQTANLCSDSTTFEIWAALLNGGCVHILDRDTVMSPRSLGDAIATAGITVLSVPSALVNHEAYRAPLAATSLSVLCFGGEAGNPHAIRALLQDGFAGRLVHLYGPTETTMLASYEPVTQLAPGRVRIPVGRPVSATELHVLDTRMRPVPPTVPGELYVGGDRLARCYAGRPALTAERFLPSPFPGRAGERLYRTGDLARQLPDGRFEILGRLDREVKVRGYRVEPGEIETALTSLPGVAEAVAVARPGVAGTVDLVAYVSPSPGRPPIAADLLRELRGRLPGHLVPSSVVVLPRLPLTPGGQVDRQALPDPPRNPGWPRRRATAPGLPSPPPGARAAGRTSGHGS